MPVIDARGGQAITTKFVGPSETRPARVRATNTSRSAHVTINWKDELDGEGNHARAVESLLRKTDWQGLFPRWQGAHLDEDRMVFVPVPEIADS